jgi:threonine dehydratase
VIAEHAVNATDVDRAVRRLGGVALRTPTLVSAVLDERAGTSVFCKAEGLQRTGSFKLRGAWNAISAADGDELAGGVITYSSGNHARALAFAARMRGSPARSSSHPTRRPSSRQPSRARAPS